MPLRIPGPSKATQIFALKGLAVPNTPTTSLPPSLGAQEAITKLALSSVSTKLSQVSQKKKKRLLSTNLPAGEKRSPGRPAPQWTPKKI